MQFEKVVEIQKAETNQDSEQLSMFKDMVIVSASAEYTDCDCDCDDGNIDNY